jgi:phage baseplate assembly protein W
MQTLDHPYHFDGHGRTAASGESDHVRDLIEQVLFTSPGERVMRPDFGAGLLALVFEPNSSTLAATTQFLVQSALQQHLSHLIAVTAVEVEANESSFQVRVSYVLLSDSSTQQANFALPGGAGGGL